MAKSVIVDAGAIVALLNPRDQWHRWADRESEKIPAPMLTCEAALSETFYMLNDQDRRSLWLVLEHGTIRTEFSLFTQEKAVADLMRKYIDVPMSFADACLVRMTELLPESAIFTTDSDFKIYRRNGRQVIPLISPF